MVLGKDKKLLLECKECIEQHKKDAEKYNDPGRADPDCFWCMPASDEEYIEWKKRKEKGNQIWHKGG